MEFKQWSGFAGGAWQEEVNVRDFIQKNYRPYEGDDSFLSGPTERTSRLMEKLNRLFELERSFEGIRTYLETHVIEGIVFWKDGHPRCKIKRKDFGFPWGR